MFAHYTHRRPVMDQVNPHPDTETTGLQCAGVLSPGVGGHALKEQSALRMWRGGSGFTRERFGQCQRRLRDQQETAVSIPETWRSRFAVIAKKRVIEQAINETGSVFHIVTRLKPNERNQTWTDRRDDMITRRHACLEHPL